MNLYDVLGVAPDATADQIKAAYRAASRIYHPDCGGDAEMFKKIAGAYEVLSDAQKRAEHDASIHPDADARQIIAGAFQVQIDKLISSTAQGMYTTIPDLVIAVKRDLSDDKMTQQQELNRARRALDFCEKALGRISYQGDSEDAVTAILKARLAEGQKLAASMEKRVTDISRAIELADEWHWKADEPTPTAWTKNTGICGDYWSFMGEAR
jgi:curved DNA-binding protein CbpA